MEEAKDGKRMEKERERENLIIKKPETNKQKIHMRLKRASSQFTNEPIVNTSCQIMNDVNIVSE